MVNSITGNANLELCGGDLEYDFVYRGLPNAETVQRSCSSENCKAVYKDLSAVNLSNYRVRMNSGINWRLLAAEGTIFCSPPPVPQVRPKGPYCTLDQYDHMITLLVNEDIKACAPFMGWDGFVFFTKGIPESYYVMKTCDRPACMKMYKTLMGMDMTVHLEDHGTKSIEARSCGVCRLDAGARISNETRGARGEEMAKAWRDLLGTVGFGK